MKYPEANPRLVPSTAEVASELYAVLTDEDPPWFEDRFVLIGGSIMPSEQANPVKLRHVFSSAEYAITVTRIA